MANGRAAEKTIFTGEVTLDQTQVDVRDQAKKEIPSAITPFVCTKIELSGVGGFPKAFDTSTYPCPVEISDIKNNYLLRALFERTAAGQIMASFCTNSTSEIAHLYWNDVEETFIDPNNQVPASRIELVKRGFLGLPAEIRAKLSGIKAEKSSFKTVQPLETQKATLERIIASIVGAQNEGGFEAQVGVNRDWPIAVNLLQTMIPGLNETQANDKLEEMCKEFSLGKKHLETAQLLTAELAAMGLKADESEIAALTNKNCVARVAFMLLNSIPDEENKIVDYVSFRHFLLEKIARIIKTLGVAEEGTLSQTKYTGSASDRLISSDRLAQTMSIAKLILEMYPNALGGNPADALACLIELVEVLS